MFLISWMCVTNHQSLEGRKKQLASVFCFAESSVYMIGVSYLPKYHQVTRTSFESAYVLFTKEML